MNPGNVIYRATCRCKDPSHLLEVASYEPEEGAADGTFELGVTISYEGIHDKEFIEIGRLLDMAIENDIEIYGIRCNTMSFDLGPRNKTRLIKTIMNEGYRLGFEVVRISQEENV